jgi:N-acetylglucosaminyldiphosphoundecaprenol N-acetyl-beta-D-mannosaminyltransferase
MTYDHFFKKVDSWISSKDSRSHHIAVINAYCVMQAYLNKDIDQIYSQADIIAPDGLPFARWMEKVDNLVCDQFDANSILHNLALHSQKTGYTFYLYGGHEDVLVAMRKNLLKMYPNIKIVGAYSPPFRALTEDEDRKICDEINAVKPDIIFVGLGTPKQDYWIDQHLNLIKGAVFIPSGAIFDFIGGRIKRAPEWVSQSGFEWLYRLLSKDFFRLWYRYTVLNIRFIWNFVMQIAEIKKFRPRRQIRPD